MYKRILRYSTKQHVVVHFYKGVVVEGRGNTTLVGLIHALHPTQFNHDDDDIKFYSYMKKVGDISIYKSLSLSLLCEV